MSDPTLNQLAQVLLGQRTAIAGKVASVLDEFRVVVNVGYRDGVREGQNFLIYAIGDEIVDPDSQLSLGRLEVLKGRGVVKHVQDTIATLESSEREEVKRQPQHGLFGAAAVETTRQIKPFIRIAIGDLVRRV